MQFLLENSNDFPEIAKKLLTSFDLYNPSEINIFLRTISETTITLPAIDYLRSEINNLSQIHGSLIRRTQEVINDYETPRVTEPSDTAPAEPHEEESLYLSEDDSEPGSEAASGSTQFTTSDDAVPTAPAPTPPPPLPMPNLLFQHRNYNIIFRSNGSPVPHSSSQENLRPRNR